MFFKKKKQEQELKDTICFQKRIAHKKRVTSLVKQKNCVVCEYGCIAYRNGRGRVWTWDIEDDLRTDQGDWISCKRDEVLRPDNGKPFSVDTLNERTGVAHEGASASHPTYKPCMGEFFVERKSESQKMAEKYDKQVEKKWSDLKKAKKNK